MDVGELAFPCRGCHTMLCRLAYRTGVFLSEAQITEAEDSLYDVVGDRIRTQRTMLGLSQDELGRAIGVSFQQVQKYENGSNQISLSRLVKIAAALQTSIAHLISGFDPVNGPAVAGFAESGQAAFGAEGDMEQTPDAPLLRQRETLELVRAYYSVADDKKRRKILDFIKSMGDE